MGGTVASPASGIGVWIWNYKLKHVPRGYTEVSGRSQTPFVHLHCHSDYSLLDGACAIPQLMSQVAAQGMPAVALTGHGNLFGAVQFYHAAREKGIHPVIGCEVYVSQQGHKSRSDTDRYNHLILLCENQEGYRNLIKLVSTAFLVGFYYKLRIDKDLLARHAKGLIALSACLRGAINETLMADRCEEGKRLAYTYTDIFGRGNFFLEIQDHGLEQDRKVMPAMVRLSQETGIPLVATNDTHYLKREDARSHEIMLCIQTGKTMSDPSRMRWPTPEFFQYLTRQSFEHRRPHLERRHEGLGGAEADRSEGGAHVRQCAPQRVHRRPPRPAREFLTGNRAALGRRAGAVVELVAQAPSFFSKPAVVYHSTPASSKSLSFDQTGTPRCRASAKRSTSSGSRCPIRFSASGTPAAYTARATTFTGSVATLRSTRSKDRRLFFAR